MPHQIRKGSHVLADFGSGYVLAHVVSNANATDDGVKYTVQAPDGTQHELGYREAGDIDAAGSGRTFKKL